MNTLKEFLEIREDVKSRKDLSLDACNNSECELNRNRINKLFNIALKEDFILFYDGRAVDDYWDGVDPTPIEEFWHNNGNSYLVFEDEKGTQVTFKIKYLKEFDLPDSKPLKSMSKGMRKKLEIATALAHKPKLLILDEPTSGLDPVVRSEVLEIFQKFIQDEEHSILLSTHITSDLEHIADEIIFIDKGKKVLQKSRDEIIDNYGILKCDIDYFSNIDKKDIIAYKKTKYAYEILVNDKEQASKKYHNCVIDKITLEDLMVLVIKGEKIC